MKYYKKLKVYKNSTGSNIFNPETKEAYSYRWWLYCTKSPCGEYLIFNNSTYSTSTRKHQSETLSLIGNTNKTIMLHNTLVSLDKLEAAFIDEIQILLLENYNMYKLINKPRTRKTTNERRKEQMERNTNRVKEFIGYLNQWGFDTSTINVLHYSPVMLEVNQLKREVPNAKQY